MATMEKHGIVLGADEFNFSVHDACVTILNPATGQHRTFCIETQSDDASFAPGKRVVSLLIGPNRSEWSDWQSFAFATDQGIKVWRSYGGTDFERFANMLENPIKWQAKGAEYMAEIACRRCGRPLTHPESIQTGLGPICAGK